MSGGISIKAEGPRVVLDIGAGRGASGASAYQAWLAAGNSGSVSDFIGDVNYQTWLSVGNVGTKADFLNSLKGAAGPGLNNRDQWVSGSTYASSDYVFADDGNGGQAMFIARGTAGHTFVSTLAPKNDASNWNKLSAPQGPPGTTALTTTWGDGTATDKAPVVALVQSKLDQKADATALTSGLSGKLDATTTAVVNKLGFAPAPSVTFDAAPAVILPANTPVLDITGKAVAGDFGDASYRAVATQPSHQGKIQIGSQWYELMGEFVMPDQFLRTGDTDDRASFQRAFDYMSAKGVNTLKLAPRGYDVTSGQISINQIAVQLIGCGFTESGRVNGWNTAISTSFTENARGSWIRTGLVGSSQFVFSGGNARGSYIDQVGFAQTHNAPAAGWTPTDYGYVIDALNMLGGLEIGRVNFLGCTRGIRTSLVGRLAIHNVSGQIFKQGLDVDQAYDTCYLNRWWTWGFVTGADPVVAYQQANLDLIRLGRVDGFNANFIGNWVTNKGINIYPSASGPASGITINAVGMDFTKYGLYLDNAHCDGWIGYHRCQSERVPTGGGLPTVGSSGIYATANAQANNWAFGKAYIDRPDVGIKMVSGASTQLDFGTGPTFANLQSSGLLASIANGNYVHLGCREGWDGTGQRADWDNSARVLRAISPADNTLVHASSDASAAGFGIPVGGMYVRSSDNVVVVRAS